MKCDYPAAKDRDLLAGCHAPQSLKNLDENTGESTQPTKMNSGMQGFYVDICQNWGTAIQQNIRLNTLKPLPGGLLRGMQGIPRQFRIQLHFVKKSWGGKQRHESRDQNSDPLSNQLWSPNLFRVPPKKPKPPNSDNHPGLGVSQREVTQEPRRHNGIGVRLTDYMGKLLQSFQFVAAMEGNKSESVGFTGAPCRKP